MKQQLISIITINYNNKNGLEETIKSVISQTYSKLEYIIIDGGSSDESVDIIKKYANKINYWVSEPDKGIYNAMNKGVIQAHGEYCIFMNSGDCFHDQNVLCSVFSGIQNADIITGITQLKTKPIQFWYPPKEISFKWFHIASLSHQASFIKTNLLIENPYNENFKIVSDWAFFMQTLIINGCTYKPIQTIICIFDMGGISNTKSFEKERQLAFQQMFPTRILIDYQKFIPANDLVERYNKTSLLGQKIILFITKLISKFWRR